MPLSKRQLETMRIAASHEMDEALDEIEWRGKEIQKLRDALIDESKRWTKGEQAILAMVNDIKENVKLKREVSELLQEQRLWTFAIERFPTMWVGSYPKLKCTVAAKLKEEEQGIQREELNVREEDIGDPDPSRCKECGDKLGAKAYPKGPRLNDGYLCERHGGGKG